MTLVNHQLKKFKNQRRLRKKMLSNLKRKKDIGIELMKLLKMSKQMNQKNKHLEKSLRKFQKKILKVLPNNTRKKQ